MKLVGFFVYVTGLHACLIIECLHASAQLDEKLPRTASAKIGLDLQLCLI